MRNSKTDICAYCGCESDNTSLDHVVPQAFWLKRSQPSDHLTVHSCSNCHAEIDQFVEYTRNLTVAIAVLQESPSATAIYDGPVTRSLERNRMAQEDLLRALSTEAQPNHDGQPPIDSDRFTRTLKKIVRGLYWLQSGEVLPAEYEVSVYPGSGFLEMPQFTDLIDGLQTKIEIGDKSFQCRCACSPLDPSNSVWLLGFYQSVCVLAWTAKAPTLAGTN